MNRIASLLLALAVLAGPAIAVAEKVLAGPKGGRLLDTTPLKTEFLVTNDRRIEIFFYEATLQPAAPGEQTVSVTAELDSGRTAIALERTPAGFVSSVPLPEATMPLRVVVQVREKPGAKPQNFRLALNLAVCAGCDHPEYACTCESH